MGGITPIYHSIIGSYIDGCTDYGIMTYWADYDFYAENRLRNNSPSPVSIWGLSLYDVWKDNPGHAVSETQLFFGAQADNYQGYGNTWHYGLACFSNPNPVDDNVRATMSAAGVVMSMLLYVRYNNLDGPTTVTLLKNGSETGFVLTFAAGSTGIISGIHGSVELKN